MDTLIWICLFQFDTDLLILDELKLERWKNGNFGNGKPRFGKDEIPRRIRNGKIKRSAGELGRRVRRLNI